MGSLLVACSDTQERADRLLHPGDYLPPEDASILGSRAGGRASIDAGAGLLDAAQLPQSDAAAVDGAAR